MEKLNFVNEKNGRLLKVIADKYTNVSYKSINSALRKKDILVDGVRVKENIKLEKSCQITLYINPEEKKSLFNIFYEDDNIIIINKFKGIEICDGEDNVEKELGKKYSYIKAVHRIDKNTSGLCVFAKSEKVLKDLVFNMQKKNIRKLYIAKVFGYTKDEADLTAYLVKDSKNKIVKIYDSEVSGSVKIRTKYKFIKKEDNISFLEVELFNGKTHQIRAHLAHKKIYIVGDSKYGDNKLNKLYNKKRQCLTSYKLIFNLKKDDFLSYLNDIKFELKELDM